MKRLVSVISAVCLILPVLAIASPEDYRFPSKPGTTKDGYPLPLSGKPLTKTPVIARTPGADVKKYAEHYIPGREILAEDEMRVTSCGSWATAPLRTTAGASCLLVQLGNGDAFIFDIGDGSHGNLYSLGVHPAELDKLFITHLHLDHVGGILGLFDTMGWARNTPLRVWGPSGYTPELGTAAFTQNIRQAAEWHVQSKQNVLPTGGTTMTTREIDIDKFSPEQPRQLAYEENERKDLRLPGNPHDCGSNGLSLGVEGINIRVHG